MSAVLTRRRTKGRGRDREGYRQPSLFGQVVSPPPPLAPHEGLSVEGAVFDVPTTDTDAESGAQGIGTALLETRTLDDAISGLWTGLRSGEPGACPVCGSALEPRHSAGSGVVGGRCGGCSTTLA